MKGSQWLDPVRLQLDALRHPTGVYFRDDHAGRRDDRLDVLLGLFSDRGLACDVAVDPDGLSPSTTDLLTGWGLVDGMRFHQHGGRDVVAGRETLRSTLGDLLDDVYTPDARGCTPRLASSLVGMGIRTLVTRAGAPSPRVPGLVELTVAVDWPGRAAVGRTREVLGRELAAAVARPGPVGIGLHHLTAEEEQLDAVAALLGLLAGHEAATPTTITRLVGPPPGDRPATGGRAGSHWPSVVDVAIPMAR